MHGAGDRACRAPECELHRGDGSIAKRANPLDTAQCYVIRYYTRRINCVRSHFTCAGQPGRWRKARLRHDGRHPTLRRRAVRPRHALRSDHAAGRTRVDPPVGLRRPAASLRHHRGGKTIPGGATGHAGPGGQDGHAEAEAGMKTLVRGAARVYPAAWRARYGVEMEALLEDAGSGGGDLWDIVRGALFMQMTSLSFWKILAGCSLAGMLAAGTWAATRPNRYVSSAVMRVGAGPAATDGEAKWAALGRVQAVLSRSSLATIIIQQNLYAKERLRYPMEDVTQEMRNRHLRISVVDPGDGTAFAVSFDNENPAAAQATVRAVVSSLAERHVQGD